MDDCTCNFCGAGVCSREMLLVREEGKAAICDRCVEYLARMVAEHHYVEALMDSSETRH